MQDILLQALNTVNVNELTSYVRLLARSNREQNGCLTAASVYDFGYAKSGKMTAHRLSWTVNNGLIPKGMFVCHACDNPACHEISHLFLGTPKDNARDKAAKGRSIKGSAHHNTTLTEEIVRQIKTELHTPTGQLARKYNTSREVIESIRHERTWKHVTD